MMKIPPARIQFTPQDIELVQKEMASILRTGQLTLGPHTERFERDFAAFTGLPHAVAVNSGTSALEIILRIQGVQGKDVLLPTNTFFATALAVMHAGGNPVYVDADPETFSLSLPDLKKRVTAKTAGVVAVHISGILSPAMPELADFCRNRKIFLVEDAAHAHGSILDGAQAGTWGEAAAYSFYPTKLMTCGEGGMIVTRSEKVHDESKLYRDQGKVSFTKNEHGRLGYNWRLSEIHALVGTVHLSHLKGFVEERRRIAVRFDQSLEGLRGLAPLRVPDRCRSNYYKYLALLDDSVDRERFRDILKAEFGVSLGGEVYKLPCHLQPFYEGRYRRGDYPAAEKIGDRHVCLPLFNGMTDPEIDHVISSVKETLKKI